MPEQDSSTPTRQANQQGHPTLTREAKQAIWDYLRNWMIALGVANLAVVVGFGVYVIQSINGIREQANTRINASVANVEKLAIAAAEQEVSESKSVQSAVLKTITLSVEAADAAGQLNGRIDSLGQEITSQRKKLDQLKKAMEDSGKYTTFINNVDAFLEDNPGTEIELAEFRRQVEKTESKLTTANTAIKRIDGLISDQQALLQKLSSWVALTYYSAQHKGIYKSGSGEHRIDYGWVKDHVKHAPTVLNDLGIQEGTLQGKLVPKER